MTSEQEIRASAVQAAATCFSKVSMGDPRALIEVAEMMEEYIREGGNAARAVIQSWDSPSTPASAAPQVTPQESESPDSEWVEESEPNPRAQALADTASRAGERSQLSEVVDEVKRENLANCRVLVGEFQGPLSKYLNTRWSELVSGTPLYERNKKHAPRMGSAHRAELGL